MPPEPIGAKCAAAFCGHDGATARRSARADPLRRAPRARFEFWNVVRARPGGSNRLVPRFRNLLALAATLVSTAVLASCADRGAGNEPLVFWAMGSEATAAESVLAGFRSRHPDIAVRVQRVPWSAAHEKLLTAYVGGSMPDVFQLGNTWVAELATLGALEPLDARVAASGEVVRADFFEGVLAANEIDGRLVALPWYVDTRLLFYRTDLLEKAGVTSAPQTWDEWALAMRRVRETAAADGTRPFGIFLPVDEWQTPVILALQQGGPLLRDHDTRGNFRSTEVRRAFEFYASLFQRDLAPRKAEAQLANLYREFAAGYFAFFVTGPWNLHEVASRLPAELAGAWTTAPMPGPTGPGVSVAGGASLAISSASSRKDDAWKLVEYLSSADVQAAFRRVSGDLPSRRSAWDRGSVPADARAAAFRTQLDRLVATPKIPEWERIASKITLHLERLVRGETTIEEALADLDADVDAILAKRRSLAGKRGRIHFSQKNGSVPFFGPFFGRAA
jgi:multiple sugar transport system substrate-binding protein